MKLQAFYSAHCSSAHLCALISAIAAFFFCSAAAYPPPTQADFVIRDFHFQDGETLAQLRIHYATLGVPRRDASGTVRNAVLIMHGTGGSSHQFLNDYFAGVLFAPGALLDAAKYFIILPDDIGHGKSSKPSDGRRMKFPQYDYHDMVAAEYALVTQGLHVDHLRLVMGTSMGCMHSWMWGEEYPTFEDALMPLACLPVQIAGRNRMWRKMVIDSIRDDPGWNGGNYTSEPFGLEAATHIFVMVGGSPLVYQKAAPTRDAADAYLASRMQAYIADEDANDVLYQVAASRDYDPSADLEKIRAPVLALNTADDQINPPELGIAEREIKRVRRGQFVLLPISDTTRGHGTHTLAAVWQQYLATLLEESGTR